MTDHERNGPGAPTALRCEYLTNPLGIDERVPRLSWLVSDERRAAVQSAYRILVGSSPDGLDEADVWDSGRVESDRCTHVEYAGPKLESGRRYRWKVRTWDADGEPSPWSEAAWWEMGLLDESDWSAEWVGMTDERRPAPASYLRREFRLELPVRRARLYVTALGLYELRLNGEQVGDRVFAPGWTDYRKRVMYQTYDVTDLLREGDNAVGAVLGEGWYCGQIGWGQAQDQFGEHPPRLLAQLEVEFEDGTTERVATGGTWRCAEGPIRRSQFYDGELYDARREMPGWDEAGFDDADWSPAETYDDTGAERNAQQHPPIRVTEEVQPVDINEVEPDRYIFDMGQNMVGFCRLRVSGPAGTEVTLRHAEVLNDDGTLYTENLRKAKATDTYVLRGDDEEVFRPHFTYHGFRYVEVTGYPGTPGEDALTGLVVHNDCERTGHIETSSEMVNRLQENIVWGQRGNMHSVLTDCPQRDERLGWMGDAQIFAPTACYNMDMAAMLTKFARDMVDEQTPEGAFPDVCPYLSPAGVLPPAGAPAWMDAGVIVPWTVYEFYGDERILKRHFESMCRYVQYVTGENPGGIWENARGNDYGDWVPAGEQTDKTMFATLNHFYSTALTARAARVLGRDEVAERYEERAEKVRDAFNERYLQDDGTYENATQTVDALVLAWGVVPGEHRRSVADDLVANIEGRGGHLSTGFGGTQWLLPALCETGHEDVAHRLLLTRDYPSWGYMLEKGATTIWELWNSDTEGPGMNSRNHFAYGSVGQWMFGWLAGIHSEAGDWARFSIRPHPGRTGGELERVRASYASIRGEIVSQWEATDDGLRLTVRVPASCRAAVYLPAAEPEAVTEDGAPLEEVQGIGAVSVENGHVVCDVMAGAYKFRIAE